MKLQRSVSAIHTLFFKLTLEVIVGDQNNRGEQASPIDLKHRIVRGCKVSNNALDWEIGDFTTQIPRHVKLVAYLINPAHIEGISPTHSSSFNNVIQVIIRVTEQASATEYPSVFVQTP